MTLIEYINSNNIVVKFDESGYEKTTRYKQFKEGRVKSPYCRTNNHHGYLGEGKYKVRTDDGVQTKAYTVWQSMLQRCYGVKYHQIRPTYIGCTVCEEWLNYQTFAEWFDNNYYEVISDSKRGMALDKDILDKGNKVYCPDYCVFVPDRINLLFINVHAVRGDLPIGVSREGTKYTAHCSINDNGISKQEQIGKFSTIEEAFNAYKEFKETYIKKIAEEYKHMIPKRLYDALYKYKVSIDD